MSSSTQSAMFLQQPRADIFSSSRLSVLNDEHCSFEKLQCFCCFLTVLLNVLMQSIITLQGSSVLLSLSTRPHITQTLTKRQQTCRCSKVNMVNSGILELVSTILVIQHSVKYLGVKSQQFHLIHL